MADDAHRTELVARLDMAGRVLSTAAVVYHGALAALGDLSAVELKAMDFLQREGAMTARALAARTGLAPASITALVDRLERKGFAHRIANPEDGRSVLIRLDEHRIAQDAHLYDDFVGRLHALYAGYSDAELEVVTRFLTEAAQAQTDAAAALPTKPES
jgi:DNA-binding MarR family transcriptional regulator